MNSEVKEQFSRAVRLKDGGHYDAAMKVLMELESVDQESEVILTTLGDVCWEIGRLEEAASVFKRAIKVAPSSEVASLGLFHVLWELGRRVEAMKEVIRFQSIGNSKNYEKIVEEINRKW